MSGSRQVLPVEPIADRRRLLSHTNAYRVHSDGIIEIYDLDFAAYCLMRDLAIADMIEDGQRRPARYIFTFQGTKEQIQSLAVDYTNSESGKFADSVRRLKKAIRSTSPREG